jgi:hypothetical protein
MRYLIMISLTCFLLFQSAVAFADTQHITVSSPFVKLNADISPHVTKGTAEINNDAQGAEGIMAKLIPKFKDGSKNELSKDKNFYCIFHLLKWSDVANHKQTVQAENWYLYHRGKLTVGSASTIPRLYGARNVTFLYIHFNKDPNDNEYTPLYRFEVEKKTPAYINDLLGLAGLANSILGGGNAKAALAAPPEDWFGVANLTFDYKVADITATPKLTRLDQVTIEDMGRAQKFDNEGKYFVDFSVGVPVRKISELEFSSTNNTVTANEIDKTKLFAFVNLYAIPVDIKSSSPNLIPHFVGGVALEKQPLHKIFVGAGFGPLVANFYIGALFVKQEKLQTLNPGDPASPSQVDTDTRRRFKPQVAFGLNLPVGVIVEKLKGK